MLNNILKLIEQKIYFELIKFKNKEKFNYNDNIQHIVKEIKENGFAVFPDFYSESKCSDLRSEIDRLIDQRAQKGILWVDKFGADQRCFLAENDSQLILDFHQEKFLLSVAENYFRGKIINSNTLASKIQYTRDNIGSGQGWHRDGHNFQFKALVYLSDVDTKHGPFQIIKGSHKFFRVLKDILYIKKKDSSTRYSNEAVEKIIRREPNNHKVFLAKAGTVVLVDTSAIHTGMHLSKGGYRYALFNYYYPSYDNIEKRRMTFNNVGSSNTNA